MFAPSRRRATAPLTGAARAKGPYILEMLTYRYRGHSMSDPAKYRTREEVNKVRDEHDPIDMVHKRLVDNGWASEDELKAIEKGVRDRVTEAADFAQAGPEPDPSELWTDISTELPPAARSAGINAGDFRQLRGDTARIFFFGAG